MMKRRAVFGARRLRRMSEGSFNFFLIFKIITFIVKIEFILDIYNVIYTKNRPL